VKVIYFKNNLLSFRYIIALLFLLITMQMTYAQDAVQPVEINQEQSEISEVDVVQTSELETSNKTAAKYNSSVVNKYNKLCQTAEKLIDKESYEKALESLNKAIELCSDLDKAYALKSIALRFLFENEKAKENAQKAYQLNPNNYIALEEMGILTSLDGNYKKAIFFFDKAEQLNKNYDRTYANRGFTYFLSNEYEKSIADFNIANKLNPNSVFIHSYRAEAYLEADAKKYAKLALVDANFLVQHEPKNMDWYRLRARCYANLNNVPMALADINKAVKNESENFQSYIDRLEIYEIINASDSLVSKDIELAERYAGNSTSNLLLLADYAKDKNNNTLEERLIDKVLAINPLESTAICIKADMYINRKDYSNALASLNKIDLSSIDSSALPYFYILRANAKLGLAGLEDKQLIKEGIADINKNFSITDNLDKLLYASRAYAYIALGEYQLGLDDINKAQELGTLPASIVYWQDLANLKLGKLRLNDDTFHSIDIIASYKSSDNLEDIKESFDNTPDEHIAAKINTVLFYDAEDLSILGSGLIMKLISKIENSVVNIEQVYEQNGEIIVFPYKNAVLDYGHNVSKDMKNKIIQQLAYKAFAVAVYQNDDDIDTPLAKFLEKSNVTQKINGLLSVIDEMSVEDVSALNKIIESLSVSDSSVKTEQDKIKQILRKAYVKLAYAEERKNGLEEAMYYYNKAIDYGYSKYEIYSEYASYYYDENDYFNVVKWATQALKVKNNAYMFALRGDAKAELSDYDGAIYDYTKALGYDAKLYDVYYQRASVYFDQKKWALAQADYLKYVGYNKTEASAPFNIATCLQNQGKKQAAIPWYEKAKSLYQDAGNQEGYDECVRRINRIKGYSTWW
jgi:tetratricopeptide (TPR) repeat protein